MSDLYNALDVAATQGSWLQGFGQSNYTIRDKRTKRQRLEDKLAANKQQIAQLEVQNTEIKQALELLDTQPLLEKLDNLMTKLVG